MNPPLFTPVIIFCLTILLFFSSPDNTGNFSANTDSIKAGTTYQDYTYLAHEYKEVKDFNTYFFLMITSANEAMTSHQYQKADSILNVAIKKLKEFDNDTHYQYYRLIFTKGLNFSNWFIPDSANKYWDIALELLNEENIADKADILSRKAYLLRTKKLNKEAIKLYEEAKQLLKETSTYPEALSNLFNNLAIAKSNDGDFEEAISYYNQALNYSLRQCNEITPMVAQIKYNIGISEINRGRFHEGEEALIEVLKETKDKPDCRQQYFLAKDQLAGLYKKFGLYKKALNLYLEVIEERNKYNEEPVSPLANAYMKAGLLFQEENNNDRALEYFLKAEELLSEYKSKMHIPLAFLYSYTGSVYLQKENPGLALEYFKRELEIMSFMLGNNNSSMSHRYINVGSAYEQSGKRDSAVKYYQTALNVQDGLPEKNISFYSPAVKIARFFLRINQTDKAISILNEAKKVAEVYNPGGNEVEEIYNILSGIYYNVNIDSALTYSDKIYKRLINSVTTGDQYIYRSTSFLYKYYLLRGKIFLKKNDERPDHDYLTKGYDNLDLSFKYLKEYFSNFSSSGPGEVIALKGNELFELLMKVSYELYNKTSDIRYLNSAFAVMEMNRSAALIEAINKIQHRKVAGIPDSVIDTENEIYNRINFYKLQLQDAEAGNNFNASGYFHEILFSLNNKADSINNFIEKQYPAYAGLYNSDYSDLMEVTKNLKQGNLVINYYSIDRLLYAIAITSDTSYFYIINKGDEFEESLKHHLFNISNKPTATQTVIDFRHHAKLLYDKLFIPGMLSNITDITIMADGTLAGLPFETLIPKEGHYLLEKYAISYLYSHTVKNLTISNDTDKEFYIGFAANLSDTSYSHLSFVEREVSDAALIMNGEKFLGDKATKYNFLKMAGSYKIIHFALHGHVNNETFYKSRILFNDNLPDYELNYWEILNLPINAELVVLSSCNSGSGMYMPGEGNMHLARAFAYAGCRSMLMNLWEVNDFSSAEVIKEFYKNIRSGLSKDEALKQAKLAFVSNNEDPLLDHPYYWASLVITGDTSPVEINKPKTKNAYLNLVSLAAVVLFLTAVIIRNKK